jgi:hypothetical protein
MSTRQNNARHYKLNLIVISAITLLALTAGKPDKGFAYEWTWMNPLPQGNHLNSVWGSSATNVFAVGGPVGGPGIILHFDGSAWSQMQSGVTDFLNGIFELGTVTYLQ